MSLRRHRATLALAAWTLVVWATRVRNIASDADLDTAGKFGRTALALSFTVLAVAVAGVLWQRRRSPGLGAVRGVVLALAGWTTGVWVVRMAGIAAGDHDAAFVAVHLALAVVSVVLAAAAVREVTGERAPGTDDVADVRSG